MDAILPLIGVVIGGLLGLLVSIVTHHLQRRERAEDRRAEFQQDTLIHLQQVMHDAGRLAARIHLHDVREARQGVEYGRALMGNGLSEETRLVSVELLMLTERVLDDELRQRLRDFHDSLIAVERAKSEDEGILLLNHAVQQHLCASSRLGVLLRATY